MNRFLIRPRVHCENLATQVLSRCTGRVAEDFERRYGLRPWLLESFVDGSRYDGACYKAGNWVGVGQTKGRGRNGARDAGQSRKDIYLYPLVADVRERMGVEPVSVEALTGELPEHSSHAPAPHRPSAGSWRAVAAVTGRLTVRITGCTPA